MSVASKNLFDLLGNDEGDSDGVSAPVKTVDKASTRTVKRNTDGEAPAPKGPVTSTRRGGYSGNEAAFRDRGAGSDRNRGKPTDEFPRGGPRGGHNARVRGGRGARFSRGLDDRHSKHTPSGGSEKTAAQGWGATEGDAELKDEQAGENIAKKDEKEAAVEETEGAGEAAAPKEDETPAEPEDKHISYADYLAQLAEKKLALEAEAALNVRKPNEGTKANKQWASAKPLVKDEDDEFISGNAGKAKRERERKTKQVVEIDQRYVEPERPRGGRGGRGGGRGDFGGRGGPRGGRGAPRGDFRGDFRGGDFRGGRGGSGRGGAESLNPNDEKAFPSLGK